MKQKPTSRRTHSSTRSVLRLPDLERAKAAVNVAPRALEAWRYLLTILHGALYESSALKVVKCDQTSVLATSMMLRSEEVRRPLQRPV
jgi:hypothetical protein